MLWIKRNLFFFLGMVVAVALFGFGVYNLVDKFSQDTRETEDMEQQLSTLKSFYDTPGKAFPSKANINMLQGDIQKLQRFSADCRPFFAAVKPVQFNSLPDFKNELVNMIAKLNSEARSAGVLIPTNYSYAFQTQVPKLNISQPAMRTLSLQMAEVQQLCDILFAAKINRLEGVQRARTEDDFGPGAADADYVAEPIRTTPLGTVYPYRLNFRCFSSELAGVLEGFIKSPYGFVIKTVEVEAVPLDYVAPVPGYVPPGGRSPNPIFVPPRQRPPFTMPGQPNQGGGRQPGAGVGGGGRGGGATGGGRGNRGGGGGGTRMLELNASGQAQPYQDLMLEAPAPAAPSKGGLVTLVNEKPFRVSIYLESVELLK
jgi:hypothetical protein